MGIEPRSKRIVRGGALPLALASVLAGCSSDSTGPPPAASPTLPPAAANLVVAGGDAQTAVPGAAVASAPEVRVTTSRGQGVYGVAVRFTVIAGGGSVASPNSTTDGQGVASAGTWTLGGQEGTQQLRATVTGLGSVTFTATAAQPSAPAAMELVAGDGQAAEVGTALEGPLTVRVVDGGSNPVAGVQVTFTVIAGGGSASGAVATTDGSGRATAGGWVLGTVAGLNALRASVTGVPAVSFTATATPGPAATVEHQAGNAQGAEAGTALPVRPSVRVLDAYGNGVEGVDVTFAVLAGGGSIQGPAQTTTGAGGIATAGVWTLGAMPGINTARATAAGSGIAGNPVFFTATGTPPSSGVGAFDIEIRFNPGSSPDAAQDAAFDAAESMWESIIQADLPDVPVQRPAGTCSSSTPIAETIDDLVIWVTLETIDGPGGTLGIAGPCLVRLGSSLPLAGSMRFDLADLDNLEANGLLDEVILHEMGHVLGLGTLWPALGLLADPATSGGVDPHFTGSRAIDAFDGVGGAAYAGNKVPVEAGGGPGTKDGHWREDVFDRELMTGWIDLGSNPLSVVTVAALDDMGYTVDEGEADPFSLPVSTSVAPRSRGAAVRMLGDMLLIPVEVLDGTGRTAGTIPR